MKLSLIIALVLCGLALASYSIASAFLNGMRMAPEPIGYVIGGVLSAFFVWATLAGWLAMRAATMRAWGFAFVMLGHWLFFTALALSMSIGFVAGFRGDTVSVRQSAIDTHARAAERRAALLVDLKTAQALGKRTGRMQEELKTLDNQLAVERPAVADYQAEALSWVTRQSPQFIAHAMPIAMAVASDVGPAGCLMALEWLYSLPKPEAPIRKRKRRRRKKAPVIELAHFRQNRDS